MNVIRWTGRNFTDVETFLVDNFTHNCNARQRRQIIGNVYTVPVVEFNAFNRAWVLYAGSVLVLHRDPRARRKIEILPGSVFDQRYTQSK